MRILFVLSFLLPYPVQVFSRGEVSGVFTLLFSLSLFVCFSKLLWEGRFKKADVIESSILFIILCLVVSYVFAFVYYGGSYLYQAASKSLVFYFSLALLVFGKGEFHRCVNSLWVVLPSVVFFLAILCNSLGFIPNGAIIHDKHYYFGLIRAGAGYVDPNVIGLMFMQVISFMLFELIQRERIYFRLVITVAIIGVSVLTFSRTVQIFSLIYIAFIYYRVGYLKYIFKNVKAVSLILVVTLFLAIYLGDLVMSRYASAEGLSSLVDRARQYQLFLGMLLDMSVEEMFFGFGAQDLFKEQAGVHLHSALGAIILDVGVVIGGAVSLGLFSLCMSIRTIFGKIMAFTSCAANLILPFIPELFFVTVMFLLVLRWSYFSVSLNRG